jgi:hypothetical protein
MNKAKFLQVRESIRDNGIRYTAAHAMDINDIDSLSICDSIQNIMSQTDWLNMRFKWMKNPDTTKSNIIKLTSFI